MKIAESKPFSFLNQKLALFLLLMVLASSVVLAGVRLRRASERREDRERLAGATPRSLGSGDYATSDRCQSCHPSEHASWQRTFHRSMTQAATPDAVRGRFDGSTIDSDGLLYTVFRRGDEFWASMPDPEQLMYTVQGGKRIDRTTYLVKRSANDPIERLDLRDIPRVERQVVMTTGSHHYQTYWVRGDEKFGNLLQTLPLVFLIKDQRWIPREAAFMVPPDGERFVTQWNHHCIRCHSTAGVPGLDAESGAFDTRVGELGISCEACHGPAQHHVQVNRDPIRRYGKHFFDGGDHTIVQPEKLDHKRSSQVCGQCHGVFIVRDEFALSYAYEGSSYRPGDDLDATRYYIQHPARDGSARRQQELEVNPTFFQERWWEDGTVLAGGREFTAMSASGCYQRGEISCLSCHAMHDSDPVDQLKQEALSSAACVTCHQEAIYTTDVEQHTHHLAESDGSNCLNCHMPHTTYALLGAIRNHEISVPGVRSSSAYGVPNACNLCHLDKTLAWTQVHLTDWYQIDSDVYLTTEQRDYSAALLWVLKGNAAQRVIAAWHFGWDPAQLASGHDWLAPIVGQLLADPYGVVRYVSGEALRRVPGFDEFAYDFLDSPEAQQAVVDAVVARWQGLQRELREPAGPLLLNDQGELDESRLRQLKRQRDDRPVTIKE